MRIVINAAAATMGGSLTYLLNVLPLMKIDERVELLWVVVPDRTAGLLAPLESEGCKIISCGQVSGMSSRRFLVDQVSIPRLIRAHRADVLFSSNGFATFLSPCSQVVLVRNALFFSSLVRDRFRSLGKSLTTLRIRRLWSLLSIRNAGMVLFPTHAMKDLVAEHVDLTQKRTEVIHYGFQPATIGNTNATAPAIAHRMSRWRHEGYTVVLSTCPFAVHKNLETLVRSVSLLDLRRTPLKLVLTISRDTTGDKREFDTMRQEVVTLGLQDVVISAGHLPYGQLPWLYENADIYAYPSFCESFGHPLLEAMAYGLPIIAANTAVNREVAGDASLYFDMFNPESCASGLIKLMSDTTLRRTMTERGRRIVATHPWSTHVSSLLSALSTLIADRIRS